LKTYTYNYPKPSVTTDCIIVRKKEGDHEILLIKRKHEPYKGKWALPGGFVEIDEDLTDGAKRELEEETGLKQIDLKQFAAYGKPDRDPRGRTISVIFYGVLTDAKQSVVAGDDASEAEWYNLNELPPLAFDHEKITADFRGQILNS
jgi:8-oxo-dGTP diphosphatase